MSSVVMVRLVLILIAVLSSVKCSLFSSTEELKILVDDHNILVDEIHRLIEELELVTSYLKWKLIRYEKDQNIMNADVETYVSNPLNAFLLIKRLSLDKRHILQHVADATDPFSKNVYSLDSQELTESAEAIDRLQTAYNLKAEDLARGVIDRDNFNITLTAYDLFIIGTEFLASQKYSRAVEYFVAALKKNVYLAEFSEVSNEVILSSLLEAHQELGNYEKAIAAIDDILKFEPRILSVSDLLNLRESLQEQLDLNEVEKFVEPEETFKEKLTRKVCSGEVKKSSAEVSKFHCRFESRTQFSKIAPFKVEEVNLNPLILLYRNVISDAEIEILKEIAKPELQPSGIVRSNGEIKITKDRKSKIAWLYDKSDEVVSKLSKRVEDMTGLSAASAEPLQVQEYGMGDYYALHSDFVPGMVNKDEGDRIATVLFYLSDVEKAGGTVFPLLNVKILVEKGSAAFWFNLHDSGEHDYRVRHSGCPVLVGNKWVANKWLHEHGQEFKRLCGTSYTDSNQLRVLDSTTYFSNLENSK